MYYLEVMIIYYMLGGFGFGKKVVNKQLSGIAFGIGNVVIRGVIYQMVILLQGGVIPGVFFGKGDGFGIVFHGNPIFSIKQIGVKHNLVFKPITGVACGKVIKVEGDVLLGLVYRGAGGKQHRHQQQADNTCNFFH